MRQRPLEAVVCMHSVSLCTVEMIFGISCMDCPEIYWTTLDDVTLHH